MMSDTTRVAACALAYHWASRLFAYPDADLRALLKNRSTWRQMAEAVIGMGGGDQGRRALLDLRQALLEADRDNDALPADHTRLFARDVLCPPYQSSYGIQQMFSRVQDLSELAGFYAAFGLRVGYGRRELQDHIALEFEFLSVLYGKEAIALEEGWTSRARLCETARRKFIREHLTWLPFFADRLRQHASLSFYPAAIAWVETLLNTEPEYADVSSAALGG
jgi:TorA maturation chaperone TorD